MNEKLEPSSEISQNLALDELQDASKRKQVEAYFKDKKGDILEVSKGRRSEMQEIMRDMNRTKAGPDKIIEAILQRLFSKSLDAKLQSTYPDQFAGVVVEENINLVGDDDTKEELNANPVFMKARGKILAALRADVMKAQQQKGKYMKPAYIDKFAEAVFRKYVKDMDEEIYGRVTESNVDNDLPIMTFEQWRMTDPSLTDETLFMGFDAAEARQFVGDVAKVKTELAKYDPKKAGMDEQLTKFFQQEITRIEDAALASQDAAIAALDEAKQLAKPFAAAQTFVKYQKVAKEKLNEVAELKDKLPDFDASIEEGYNKWLKDIDLAIAAFIAQKGAGEVGIRETVIQDLDKKLAAEKERATNMAKEQEKAEEQKEAEEKAKENEPPDPVKNPDAWLEHMGKEMGPFGGILVAFLAGHPLWEKVKKFIGKFSKKKDALEKAPMVPRVQKFLTEKYGIKGEDAVNLSNLEVAKVLKMNKAPDNIPADTFTSLQEGMKRNGATEGTAGTVLDFIDKKRSDWKDADKDEKAA